VLFRSSTSLTGDRDVTLLGDHLQPFMDFMYPHNDGIFQQDNAPCHRAGVVQNWLEEHSGEFRRMVWPPRSPDMNPIEHLWDVVERSIRTQNPAPTNIRELWAAIQTAWLNISPESSVHLWNRCHVELLHFAGLEGVLHDTRYLSHDFWHFSVRTALLRNLSHSALQEVPHQLRNPIFHIRH
jgi:hypothetical protein